MDGYSNGWLYIPSVDGVDFEFKHRKYLPLK